MPLWNLVLSGFPGSGKTTLAKRIIKDYPRFARVGGDDLRAMFFDEPYPCREESIIYPAMAELRDLLLRNNFNVVVDTTAPDNRSRKFLLDTRVSSVNSFLVLFDVERELLIERNNAVGHEGAVEIWERYWQNPSSDLPMLKFRNDSQEEFDIHYRILKEFLETKVEPFHEHFFSQIFPIKIIGRWVRRDEGRKASTQSARPP